MNESFGIILKSKVQKRGKEDPIKVLIKLWFEIFCIRLGIK